MSDIWTTSEVSVSDTSSLGGSGLVGRPVGYDPSLIWDSGTGTWVSDKDLLAAGGGRYQQRIVMIGRTSAGYGKVYFG